MPLEPFTSHGTELRPFRPILPGDAFVQGWGNPAWRDEFTGPTIDTSKWTVRTAASHGNLSYDWGVLRSENAFIVNNHLCLRISRRTTSVNSGGRIRWWDTAYLDSIGRLEERYGRWEMRAKIPTVGHFSRGMWPAFWLRNGALGEIDIMESWGDPPSRARSASLRETSTFTIHEKTTGGGSKLGRTYEHAVFPGRTNNNTASGFHIWTLEMTPTYMRAYFDGVLAVNITANGANGSEAIPWVWGPEFNSPWNMRLNTQMGDPYWSTDPDPSDPNIVTPGDFLIDYVRYWAMP